MGGWQITPAERELIREYDSQGASRKEICERLGVSAYVVGYVLRGGKKSALSGRCTRCGRQHTRKHCWCLECCREHDRERRRRGRPLDRDCSTPPPPPPGYLESERRVGQPYGSPSARDSDWADGPRPGLGAYGGGINVAWDTV